MNATLGQTLCQRRHAWGLSPEDVSHATRIPRHHLQWLESDQLCDFPGAAYALANLRRYCDALELDYEALAPLARMQLAALPAEPLQPRVLVSQPDSPVRPERSRRSGTAGTLLAAAAVAVFLVMSTVTALQVTSVKSTAAAEPIVAQPLPAYAEWQNRPLYAGFPAREHGGSQ
jgi:cytoskeletal protein RodZ